MNRIEITIIIYTVPEVLENGIQADATAYFGDVLTTDPVGIEVFHFRVVIDLNRFNGDLSAILTIMNRNNLVESLFKFSDGTNQRTFTFGSSIVAANASGMLPSQFRLLESRLIIFEDFIIYYQAPPPSLNLPITLDFDMSILVVALDPINSQSVRFAIGTVMMRTLPPGMYNTCITV